MTKHITQKYVHSRSRRNFLKKGAMCTIAGLMPLPLSLQASSPVNNSNLFINLSLQGGPDFRHLFVPPYNSDPDSYAYTFWRSRSSAHNITNPDDTNALIDRYENNYTPLNLSDTNFAILNNCGWLEQQINDSNVAIINNAFMSQNRDHSHSIIISESGQKNALASETERSGWGGRLVQQADRNIVSLSQNVKLFCNGAKPGRADRHSNERVIDMSDSRRISLQEFNLSTANNSSDPWRAYWDDAKMKRMLKSYYTALRNEIDVNSPYYPIIQNEITLRQFGQDIDTKLADYPVPESLKAFYDQDYRTENLNSSSFGQQMRNLYDAVLCRDILDMGIASLNYNGWDSHKNTQDSIEGKLNDIFGLGKGFDTLFKELALIAPDILDKIVIMVSGEFGRQLSANGAQGTDHGTGNSILLIGKSVQSGCYGEMFPLTELGGIDSEFQHTFAYPNSDIKGLTSMTQVYARICDWLEPGSADLVIPQWRDSAIETNVDMADLLLS